MVATRDPIAYRRKKAEREQAVATKLSREVWEQQKQAAIRANRKARAIKKAEQITDCYTKYNPPQIAQAHEMMKCPK